VGHAALAVQGEALRTTCRISRSEERGIARALATTALTSSAVISRSVRAML